ncbi:hypothetical protein TruAng_005731 [Truncatella angustata]|nr:hypothetical protein TruAng_005731 [Truncatella angustata]
MFGKNTKVETTDCAPIWQTDKIIMVEETNEVRIYPPTGNPCEDYGDLGFNTHRVKILCNISLPRLDLISSRKQTNKQPKAMWHVWIEWCGQIVEIEKIAAGRSSNSRRSDDFPPDVERAACSVDGDPATSDGGSPSTANVPSATISYATSSTLSTQVSAKCSSDSDCKDLVLNCANDKSNKKPTVCSTDRVCAWSHVTSSTNPTPTQTPQICTIHVHEWAKWDGSAKQPWAANFITVAYRLTGNGTRTNARDEASMGVYGWGGQFTASNGGFNLFHNLAVTLSKNLHSTGYADYSDREVER